jgi:hypothetical protein
MKQIFLISIVLVGCGDPFSSMSLAIESDAGDVRVLDDARPSIEEGPGGSEASFETGGTQGAGGFVSTGGTASAGGEPDSDAGTGGAPPSDACALVTHSNGLGQTWQDCVPLGTYNLNQAMKACSAANATDCYARAACGRVQDTVRGYQGNAILAEWGYDDVAAGVLAPPANDGSGNLNGTVCSDSTGNLAWE